MSDTVAEVGVEGPVRRFFTPARIVAAGLFGAGVVVAVVVGGVFLSGPQTVAISSGSLGAVRELTASQSVGAYAVTGQVTVASTAALFDGPDGVSIARLEAGVYDVFETVPGWAHVVVADPGADGLSATGWVVLNDVSTYRSPAE